MNDGDRTIAPSAIRKTIEVKAPIDRAFAVFAERIGEWWHKEHSIAAGTTQADVVIEPRAGGRWYEIGADLSEHMWGKVLAYEPPRRLLLGWQLTIDFVYDPDLLTEVELLFDEIDGGTRVRLEHRHLERMGAGAAEALEAMDGGWAMLLGLFGEAAEKQE